MRNLLGFGGYFYDIPYSSIDYSKPYIMIKDKIDKIYYTFSRRMEKITAWNYDDQDDNYYSSMSLGLDKFNKNKNLSKIGFFSWDRNTHFFHYFSMKNCLKMYTHKFRNLGFTSADDSQSNFSDLLSKIVKS